MFPEPCAWKELYINRANQMVLKSKVDVPFDYGNCHQMMREVVNCSQITDVRICSYNKVDLDQTFLIEQLQRSNVSTLTLSLSDMGNVGCRMFCGSLYVLNKLEHLKIEGLRKGGLSFLSNVLEAVSSSSCKLKRLSLVRCDFDSVALHVLVRALSNLVVDTLDLSESTGLDMGGVQILTEIGEARHTRHFILNELNFSPYSIKSLIHLLSRQTQVETLWLSRSFYLENGEYADDDTPYAPALYKALAAHPTMRELFIGFHTPIPYQWRDSLCDLLERRKVLLLLGAMISLPSRYSGSRWSLLCPDVIRRLGPMVNFRL